MNYSWIQQREWKQLSQLCQKSDHNNQIIKFVFMRFRSVNFLCLQISSRNRSIVTGSLAILHRFRVRLSHEPQNWGSSFRLRVAISGLSLLWLGIQLIHSKIWELRYLGIPRYLNKPWLGARTDNEKHDHVHLGSGQVTHQSIQLAGLSYIRN